MKLTDFMYRAKHDVNNEESLIPEASAKGW